VFQGALSAIMALGSATQTPRASTLDDGTVSRLYGGLRGRPRTTREESSTLVDILNRGDGRSAQAPRAERVDLHTHSTHSDGQWTPEGLVAEAVRAGIDILALTDHDTTTGVDEFVRAGRAAGILPIPAIEVSAALDDRPYHVLCYGIDPRSACWETLAATREEGRRAMYRSIFAKVRRQGYRLTESAAYDEDGRLVAHPLQAALAAAGHPDPLGETRRLFRPVILPLLTLRAVPLERLGEALAGSGALCSLAHPGRQEEGVSTRLTEDDLRETLGMLPLSALEVYHPMHTSSERDHMLQLAQRHELMVTCGSDAHGHRNGRPLIGYSADLCRPFLEELKPRIGLEPATPRDG
jgi:3',5'-nucleoside bisphosphate phosphatase